MQSPIQKKVFYYHVDLSINLIIYFKAFYGNGSRCSSEALKYSKRKANNEAKSTGKAETYPRSKFFKSHLLPRSKYYRISLSLTQRNA